MAKIQRPGKGESRLCLPRDYVVVDTETTGLSSENCDLIEVSALRVRGGGGKEVGGGDLDAMGKGGVGVAMRRGCRLPDYFLERRDGSQVLQTEFIFLIWRFDMPPFFGPLHRTLR